MECSAPGMVQLRAPQGAQDMTLHTAAVRAARMRDLKAHVVTAEGTLWNDSRTWDSGD